MMIMRRRRNDGELLTVMTGMMKDVRKSDSPPSPCAFRTSTRAMCSRTEPYAADRTSQSNIIREWFENMKEEEWRTNCCCSLGPMLKK